MTAVVYRRLSNAPPPVREIVRVAEDGSWRSWRSLAPVVGAFRGSVADPGAWAALVAGAAGADAPERVELPPDAVYEAIELGEARTARFAADAEVAGPWGELRDACRALADTLDDPVAAIALVVDGGALRLEHRGDEPIALQLGIAAAEAVRWRGGGQVGSRSARGRGDVLVEAGPGWSHAFEVGKVPGPAEGDAGRVVATVSFLAQDDGLWVPVQVESDGAQLPTSG